MRPSKGKRFREARTVHNQHGFQTMDEVMAATDVQKSIISALESDKSDRSVGYDKVATLATYYGVSADYLLGLSDIITPSANIHAIISETGLSENSVRLLKIFQSVPMKANLDFTNDIIPLSQEGDILIHYLLMKSTLTLPSPMQWNTVNYSDIPDEDISIFSGSSRKYGYVQLTGKEAFEYHCSRLAREIEHALKEKYMADAKWGEDNGND